MRWIRTGHTISWSASDFMARASVIAFVRRTIQLRWFPQAYGDLICSPEFNAGKSDEDVAWIQITVNDALVMKVCNAFGYLSEQQSPF
jgi:hypothetical protein